MKLLLVSGELHRIVTGYVIKKIEIINGDGLEIKDLYSFMQDVNPVFESILLSDEAFSRHIEKDKQDLSVLLEWMYKNQKSSSNVLILTRDFLKETEFADLCNQYENLKFLTCDYVRVPRCVYKQAFEELLIIKNEPSKNAYKHEESNGAEKKSSFFNRFRAKSKAVPGFEATDYLTKEIENISRGISRIVAVTGHRGSGVTSTVVNIAYEASKRGLNVMIIDMDTNYMGTNMYFSDFHEQTKRNEDIKASLIRTLARPQDYMTTAFNLKDKLWLTSLGYGFSDLKLIDQFFNNSKLVGLLSVFRSKFNLVILDMPMDLLKTFKETLTQIDVFGLCVPNNLHAVLSTLRNVETVFDKESASYFNAKSRVIVTKYNDCSRYQNDVFIPAKVSEMLSSGLSDSITYEMKVAGSVPYSNEFDVQIETDVPLVNSKVEYEKAYGVILLRLMEGAI